MIHYVIGVSHKVIHDKVAASAVESISTGDSLFVSVAAHNSPTIIYLITLLLLYIS